MDNKGIGNTSVQGDGAQNTTSADLSSTQRPAMPIAPAPVQPTPVLQPSAEQPVTMVSFHPDAFQPDSGIPTSSEPAAQAMSTPSLQPSLQRDVHEPALQPVIPSPQPILTPSPVPTPLELAATRPEPVQAMQPVAAPMPVFSRPAAPQAPKLPRERRSLSKFVKRAGVGALALLLIGGGAWFLITAGRNTNQTNSSISNNQVDPASRFDTLQVPLNELANLGSLVIDGSRTLSINGQLRANNSLVISPTAQPTGAVAGQMYYDAASNVLAYYNGASFVDLRGNQNVVSALGGQTGSVTIGNGLGAANGSLTNTGVLSVQGQTGAVSLTAGSGIAVNGTTLSNTGVLAIGNQTGSIALGAGLAASNGTLSNTGVIDVVAGSANLTVTNDGAGTVTISSSATGATVSSPGGTAGHLAKFSGVQTIVDSLLSESGSVVTVGGDLTVTGAFSLTTPLAVTSGGTGVATLTNNGVVIGKGTGPVATVSAGSAGQCLVSTAGAPIFQACPGSGGVSSLNSLNGALTLANASGSGTTITINDASTLQKGIAQFNSTNFSTVGGVVNTAQDINVTASPTFASLTLTSPLTLGNGGTGATTQAGARTNLGAAASGPNSDITSLSGLTTALSIGQGGTGANSAPAARTSLGAAASGTNGDITATTALNTITPTSTLVLGATSQSFILQGNIGSTLTATNGTNTTTIGFTNPAANVTLNFPALVAGTYSICTTSGNCSGSGGGVTTPGGTAGVIPKFTGSQTLANSIISDNGSTVTISGAGVIQGNAGLTIGTPSTTTGKVVLANATNANTLTLQSGATASTLTFTLPTADGSNNQCLSTNGSGVLSFETCLTGSGSGSGVISLDTLSGALVLANSSGAGSTITIDNASTSQKGIAQFNSTNFTASAGTINTIQDIATTASPTFASLTLSSPLTVPNGGTGGTNFAANGILYGNGTSALQITAAAPNSILATNVSSVPSLTQTLPAAVQGNITTLGAVTAGSLGTGFGVINTGSNITTSATVQGGIVNATSGLELGGVSINTAGTLTNVAYLNATTQAFSGINTFTRAGSGTGDATLAVTGTPVSDGTSSLIRIANAIASGNTTTNGGTYIGLNAPSSGAGSAADFLNFEQNGSSTFKVTGAGAVTANAVNTTNGYSVGGTSVITAGLAVQNATGITSSGTITFSGLNAVGVVQTNGLGVLSTSNLNLQTGPITGVLQVANGGTGANNPSNARMNLSAAQSGSNADITSTSVLNTITPTNTLTIGATSQAFILQGNKLSTLTATDGANTTTIGFVDPTAATTLNFPALTAGTYSICTTSGNCSGSGGGVTTAGGTTGKLAKFSGSQVIADSIISESGSAITIAGSSIIQGANGLTLGVGSSAAGKVVFQNATNNNTFTLQSGVTGSNLSFTLPTSDGSNTQCLSTNGSGVLAFESCLTGSGSGGGVSSLDSLVGILTLANSTGAGSTVTINDASTTQKGIAQFNSTNFSASGGTINTIQDIATSSTPSFSALNVTSATGITVGTSTTLGKIILKDGNAATFGVTIQVAPPLTTNQTLTVPDATGTICLQNSASCGFASASGSTNYIQNGTGVQASANLNIQSVGNATTTAVLTARASQTADLLQFQNSTGSTVYGGVNATGGIYSNGVFNENTTSGGAYIGSAGGTPRLMLANGTANQNWEFDNNGGILRIFRPGVVPAISLQTIGAIKFQNSSDSTTGFQVQNSSGISLLTIDTTGNKTTLGTIAPSGSVAAGTLIFADGTTDNFGATLNTTTLTAGRTITLPDATGTVCLQSSASCGFATSTGSGSYIQNQIASQQSAANYWISGTGRADTSLLTPLLDSATAAALSIGTTNATSINLNQNTTLAAGKSFTFTSGAGNFDQSASTGTFATGTGNVSLNGNTTVATNKSLTANGTAVFQDATNSTTAFQVQDASAATVLSVDTTNDRVGVGTTTPTAKLSVSDFAFSDNFNRANSSSLGANWTKRVDAGSDFQIVSNQLKMTSSDNSTHALSAYTTQGITSADYSVQSDIIFPTASDDWLSVFGRGSTFGTDDTQGYYAFASMANQKAAIYKRSGGTYTQLSTAPTVTINSGTTYTIKLVMQGTTLSLYWNGVLMTSITDSTFSSAGFAGIAVGNPNLVNSIWDNFSIVQNAASFNVNGNMVVNANGWVGIGTTSPSYALDVQSGPGNFASSVLTPLLDTATAVVLNIGTNNATAVNLNQNTTVASNKSFTANGAVLAKDATNATNAFQVQNSSGANLFTADTTNGNIVLGNDGTPAALTVRGGAATGTNIAGTNITLAASNGTGSGGSGDLIFQTASPNTPLHDADSSTSGAAVSSLTWSHTVANQSNRILVVGIATTLGQTVSNVTYAGASLTKLTTEDCAVTCHNELWYIKNPATGANNIVATFSASTSSTAAGASSYYNVDQTTPFGTAAVNTSGSATASVVVSSSANQLVIDSVGSRSGTTLTAAAPQTQRWYAVDPTNRVNGGSSQPATGSSTTMSWTLGTNTNWAAIGVGMNGASTASNILTDRLHITAAGNVGINTASPAYTLDVQGDINTSSAIRIGGASLNTAGTLSNVAYLNAATQTFTGINTFSRNGTGTNDASLVVSGTPINDAASSLIRIGGAIVSGNNAANGGTYIGLNAPSSGAGSVADFLNFQQNGTSKFSVTGSGVLTTATSLQSPLLDTASATSLSIGTTNATSINLTKSTNLSASKSLTFLSGNGNFDQSASTGTFKTGTGAVSLNGSTTVASNQSFTANGLALFKDATNATNAFQVQNSSGANLFTADTTNGAIVLGNDATPTALTVRGGAATGTNAVGANLTFAASDGTGTGGSGDLIFQTAAPAVSTPTDDGNDNTSTASTASSLTFSHTVANNPSRILIVAVGTGCGFGSSCAATVNSVTYAGINLTKLTGEDCTTGAGHCHTDLWYLVSPSTGANNVVITTSGSTTINSGASSYYNVDPTTPMGTAAVSNGAGNPSSLSVTSNTTQLVVDAIETDNAISTPSAGQTQRFNIGPLSSSTKAGAASTTSMGWSDFSSNYATIGVGLNPPAGTSSNSLQDRLHITAAGNVGINTATPGYTLDVQGDINASGAIRIGGASLNTAGTLSNVAYLNAATQTFTGINAFSRNGSGAADATLAVTGAPVNNATSSLIRIGNSIAAGNTTANGGTYIGLNAPSSGAGSVADFLNFQQNGSSTFKVTGTGTATVATSLQAPLLDTASATTLALGTTNATAVNLNQNTVIAVNKTLRVNGHTGLGTNGNTSNNIILNIDETINPSGSNAYGISDILRLNPTASDSGFHAGIIGQTQTSSGNAQNFTGGIRGVTFFAQHNGTGTLAQGYGANFYVQNTSTGTISDAQGLAISSAANSGGGVITTNYGIKVADQTVGNTNYAIYTGLGTVRFGDIVQATSYDTTTAATLNLGPTNATSINLSQNTTTSANKSVTANGLALFKDATNAANAFQVQNSSGANLLTADSTNTALVFGNDGTPSALTVRGGAATGTDVAGSNITIAASNGTGSGGSGDLIFQTAGYGVGSSVTQETVATVQQSSGTTSLNWSHTVGSNTNRLLVVGISTYTASPTSVKYGGVNLTRLSQVSNGGSQAHSEIWYLKNPTTGTATVAVAFSSSTAVSGDSVSYYNVNQTNTFGTVGTNTGTGTLATTNVTGTNANQVLFDNFSFSATVGSWSPYQTQLWNGSTFDGTAASSTTAQNGTSTTTWVNSSTGEQWADIAAPINPVSTGSGTTTLADRLHIAANGNVGIGTATPGDALSVATGNIYLGNGGGSKINMTGTPTSATLYNFYGSSSESILNAPASNGDIAFKVQNNEVARFNASGQFGLGTTNPTQEFFQSGGKMVVTSTDNAYGQLQLANTTSNGEASMSFISGATAYGDSPTSTNGSDHVWVVGASPGNAGGNQFGIYNDSVGQSILLLTTGGSGRVGIATAGAAPNQALTVNGNGAIWNSNKLFVYDDSGSTQRGYVGGSRNGDMTIASTESGKEIRIGSASNIAFWMDGNVAATDTPGVIFANKAESLSTAWNNANSISYFGKYATSGRSINAAGSINSNGGDYAEYFYQQTPGALRVGDIVTLNPSGKAEKGNPADQMLGVVSTQAGFVGNDLYDANNPNATALVGLMGQIPTSVTTENGPIHVGDSLTASATIPGAAMKATKAGMTIGKALEDYTNSDTSAVGKITVFVNATWNDPSLNMSQLGDLSTTVSQLQGQVTTLTSQLASVSAQVPYLNQPNVFKGTSDKQFEIQNTQGTALLTADTKNMVVTVAALTVTGTLTVNGHIVTGGNTPTIAAGAAACSTPTVTIDGNDESGMITVTTGTGCALGGKLSAVTFNKPYAAAPRVTITPTNASSAALQTYVDNSTASPAGFDLNATSTSTIKSGTTYSWYYMVVQ